MNTSQLQMLMTSIAIQLPVLLVCLGGGAIVITRYRQMGRSGIWALLGFGLGAVLCLLIPAVQAGMQAWLLQGGGNATQYGRVLSAFSILWAVLRAVSYAFLLIAILVGRSESRPAGSRTA